MFESAHESTLLADKIQHTSDADLLEPVEYGMVGFVLVAGIVEAPARITASLLDLDIFVLAIGDPLVYRGNPAFKRLLKGVEMLFDR